jgi:putative methionine-R-sulfoxide reductase with GAF domain
VVAVLDIDSEHLSTFDETDRVGLENLAAVLSKASGGGFYQKPRRGNIF